jgi:hypothetical protein
MQQWISRSSDTVSVKCNRIFAKETLTERWEGLSSNRIYLSHWPVVAADIESVNRREGVEVDPADWLLEERSGKLELLATVAQPIVVTYTGGFDLPDDPRPSLQALKQACELTIWEMRALAMRMQTSGIRSISHKDARVMFYDPLQMLKGLGSAAAGRSAVDSLLMHYVRLQV